MAKLTESARGWHSIQMAVLGFIGFCGVLRMGADAPGPEWVQWMSGGMVVTAFVSALWSIFMVGKVAYPVDEAADGPEQVAQVGGRLRAGIRATVLAVAMIASAGATAWWPADTKGGSVEVRDGKGGSACGKIADGAPAGILWLENADGTKVAVNLAAIAELKPVSSC